MTALDTRVSWPTAWRGRTIEPSSKALTRLSPLPGPPPTDTVGSFWTRTNVPEIDIVGADRGPVAKKPGPSKRGAAARSVGLHRSRTAPHTTGSDRPTDACATPGRSGRRTARGRRLLRPLPQHVVATGRRSGAVGSTRSGRVTEACPDSQEGQAGGDECQTEECHGAARSAGHREVADADTGF